MSTPLLHRRRLMMQIGGGGGGGEHPLPSWCTPVDYIDGVQVLRNVPPTNYSTYPPQLSGKVTYFRARWTAAWISYVCSGCFSLLYKGYVSSITTEHPRGTTTLQLLFNGIQWGSDIIIEYNLRSGDYSGLGKCIQDIEYDGTYLYVKGYLVNTDSSLTQLFSKTILMPSAPNVVQSYVSLYGGQDPTFPTYNPGIIINNSIRYYNLEIHTEDASFKYVPCTILNNEQAFFDAFGNVVWRFTSNSIVPYTQT